MLKQIKVYNMIIYELYGMPGAGKTSIINNVRAINTTSYGSQKIWARIMLAILKITVAYMPSSLRYKLKIKKIIGDKKMKPLYTRASVIHHLNNVVMIAFGYKHLKRTLYMDEGIIHRIMSFAINYDIDIDDTLKIIEIFSDCMKSVRSFYLKVPIIECFKSIKYRNRHEVDMDELEDDKLWIFLGKYEAYSDKIAEKYGHSILTRDNYEGLKQ